MIEEMFIYLIEEKLVMDEVVNLEEIIEEIMEEIIIVEVEIVEVFEMVKLEEEVLIEILGIEVIFIIFEEEIFL